MRQRGGNKGSVEDGDEDEDNVLHGTEQTDRVGFFGGRVWSTDVNLDSTQGNMSVGVFRYRLFDGW